jgi:hypothetical protein
MQQIAAEMPEEENKAGWTKLEKGGSRSLTEEDATDSGRDAGGEE